MYSYEDRSRAVELYIKLDKRIAATLKPLGYPTKNALKTWYREYEQLTCPGIFRPREIRDNGSLTARSSDEESTIYGRTDRSHIARS